MQQKREFWMLSLLIIRRIIDLEEFCRPHFSDNHVGDFIQSYDALSNTC